MNVIIKIIIGIVSIVALYFIALFGIKFYDNLQYGNGFVGSIKESFIQCCASVKSALRG